ncbi:MAG: inner membrane protein YhjD [Pseudonocardiaceae bacterium]
MSEPTGPQTDGKQPGLLERYRQRYPWLDHLVRAGETYTRNNGDHYAAAITYFSVLSLVPLLMIAFAVAGFVLAGNQQLLSELQEQVRTAAPAELGGLLTKVIEEAIASRSGVGIVGLLVALYSGLGWMSNLREALTAQWTTQPAQQRHEPEGFLRTKLVDLLALLGLGLALLVSFGITGAGTAFAGVLLDLAGLGDVFGARLVFYVLAIVLSLGGMWLVFLWVITRLPREPVSLRSAMWAAVLAAIGFELLKQAFALYLDSVSNSPTGRLFGPVIGLMVFAYFVSRFLLFVTAWAATSTEDREQEPPPPAVHPEVAGRAQGNP